MTEESTTSNTRPKQESQSSALFDVGHIAGLHGLSGVMKVRISTNNAALLSELQTVLLSAAPARPKAAGKNAPVDNLAPTSTENAASLATRANALPSQWYDIAELYFEKRMLFIKLSGVNDRTDAEKLVGMQVKTERRQLTELEDDEWWISDLVGMSVFSTEGKFAGTVCGIVGEASQLLEVKPASDQTTETILIPFVKDLVPTVDMKNRRIEVVALPGLLD